MSEPRRAGLPVREVLDGLELAEAAADMNYQESDALYAAIGEHHVSARSLVARGARTLRADEPVLEPSHTRRPRRKTGCVGVLGE